MEHAGPVPVADSPERRASAGLFAREHVSEVLHLLRADLIAGALPIDVLFAQYFASLNKLEGGSNPRPAAESPSMQDLRRRLEEGQLRDSDLELLTRVLYFAGYQRLLAKHHIRFPAFNLLDDYYASKAGPMGPRLSRRPRVPDRYWKVLGKSVGFPVGVPASVLTGGAPWVQYFALNGFNVLTYKTVRSRAHEPNAFPNWSFTPSVQGPFALGDTGRGVVADPSSWMTPGDPGVSTANSFGVPSPRPDVWMEDVANAARTLAEDQILLVSVMGDDYDTSAPRFEAVVDDFARTARLAEEAGAPAVELNLSCPNSLDRARGGVKPPICLDTRLTTAIVEATRRALRSTTPLVAKLSYLDDESLSRLVPCIAPHVDAIAGINTLQCKVVRTDGRATFPGRELAGVSGLAIRDHARDFTSRLVNLREETGRNFQILAMGGVTDPQSCRDLFERGADVVQMASGAFANPFLALECVEQIALDANPDHAPLARTP